jgi:hypothetical protein
MIIPKLGVGCFAVRANKRFEAQYPLKMVYHSYFHSIINYRIIFWRSSLYSNSIFKLQNRIIRIVMGADITDSCRELFKTLNILSPISQYIFPLVLFVVNNKNKCRMNSEIHSINTRNNSDFYHQLSHLTLYQKGPLYMGIKLHNSLLPEIKEFAHNIKTFKSLLRRFLHQY